ncbi:hypothetical protein N9230_02265 [Akkermansiaceae bacterium]|nr:hypothetical protein [Akkermansiaceae bacterium]
MGQFIEFFQYWDEQKNCFELPPVAENDPTERNYLSNRIGKALADYCAKRIDGALYTHCYEDAMKVGGYPIVGERPDFYCVTPTKQFAIESKGFSRRSVSENAMAKHKTQSKKGPLQVHFSIASVAYDLYSAPKVKYYDPPNSGVSYDGRFNHRLLKKYYGRILSGLDSPLLTRTGKESGESFIEYQLVEQDHPVKLIIHKDILAEKWKDRSWMSEKAPYDYDVVNEYMDVDGIGVRKA